MTFSPFRSEGAKQTTTRYAGVHCWLYPPKNSKRDTIKVFKPNVQGEVSTTITGWAEALASIESAMSQFMSDSALQRQALNGMESYLAEVHYPIILVLGTLMQDYSASLLLYKDGYYNIDDASKAKRHAKF